MNINDKIQEIMSVQQNSSVLDRVAKLRETNKGDLTHKINQNSIGWDSHHDHSSFGDVSRVPNITATSASAAEKVNWTDHTDFSDSGVS